MFVLLFIQKKIYWKFLEFSLIDDYIEVIVGKYTDQFLGEWILFQFQQYFKKINLHTWSQTVIKRSPCDGERQQQVCWWVCWRSVSGWPRRWPCWWRPGTGWGSLQWLAAGSSGRSRRCRRGPASAQWWWSQDGRWSHYSGVILMSNFCSSKTSMDAFQLSN